MAWVRGALRCDALADGDRSEATDAHSGGDDGGAVSRRQSPCSDGLTAITQRGNKGTHANGNCEEAKERKEEERSAATTQRLRITVTVRSASDSSLTQSLRLPPLLPMRSDQSALSHSTLHTHTASGLLIPHSTHSTTVMGPSTCARC